jgi:hypothetical protein
MKSVIYGVRANVSLVVFGDEWTFLTRGACLSDGGYNVLAA